MRRYLLLQQLEECIVLYVAVQQAIDEHPENSQDISHSQLQIAAKNPRRNWTRE